MYVNWFMLYIYYKNIYISMKGFLKGFFVEFFIFGGLSHYKKWKTWDEIDLMGNKDET